MHIQVGERAQKASIQIYESKGTLIKVLTSFDTGALIRLDGMNVLPNGMYLVNIRTEQGLNFTKKFEKVGN